MKTLDFRSDYAHSSDGLSELARLIYDVFKVDISSLDRLGHDPSVVAFGWWLDHELVANVSLYERRLWLKGEQVTAFGVQSVAVRPEWRGKGLFRDLMGRALSFADARVDLVILATATPNLYTPFGFRQVREATFSAKFAARLSQQRYRALSLNEDTDLALLRDLFSRRIPTSLMASACDHPALFMLKAVETPEIELLHLPDLDAVVAVKGRNGPSMILIDIVAQSIPSLEEIVSALGYVGERIDVHLTPDCLSWTPGEQTPVDNGYMVRGFFPPEGQAFMLTDMRI
ncbi:GNAT family N-acetyltransferase [Rhizobium rhizogenes]|uniref:GNAT family N-acetyltransferase n=1 Tax=Rhizobium rhizogenes TaxID=359 RepID=A0AA92BYQ4_RHIRH|nr:GNAT family N-acetyltransferase [Rhizobium rhizogenes]PVE49891.1 GNAT family N-acetyltransferase [Rhizobium rhizogenes]PVE62016.1 GNAT family N-acetyltransferase [Agrobacterium tumefaciens]PVE69780.1 GNAT family N-acetyltransferase [Sphingomonas sp. TPD3009]